MKRGLYVLVFAHFSYIYKTYKPLFPSGRELFYKLIHYFRKKLPEQNYGIPMGTTHSDFCIYS